MNPWATWSTIPWKEAWSSYGGLCERATRALNRGDKRGAYRLMRLIYESQDAALIAVKHVAQRRLDDPPTPGVDGVGALSDTQKLDLALRLKELEFARPYRAVSLPKKSGGMREIHIPTLADRAHQRLVKMALQPLVNHRLPTGLIGARSDAGLYSAVEEVCGRLRDAPACAGKADIADFFDHVDVDRAIENLGVPSFFAKRIQAWMAAPSMRGDRLIYRSKGAPQGAPLATMLAHATLIGLEDFVRSRFPSGQQPLLVIYCDDILVLADTEADVYTALDAVTTWLNDHGYRLNPKKSSSRSQSTVVPGVSASVGQEGGDFEYLGIRFEQVPATPEHHPALWMTVLSPSADQSPSAYLTSTEETRVNVRGLQKATVGLNTAIRTERGLLHCLRLSRAAN